MSLNTSTQEQIDVVIQEWITQGKMFTAFQVSLAVKDRGVEERHRNMRDYVHQSIHRLGGNGGNYSRTLMDVGAPEQAWVYHPLNANPYEYEPLERNDAPPVARTSLPRGVRNPSRLSTTHASPSSIPAGAYGTDQRGRLTIPVHLLSQLTVGPGERVQVLCDASNEQVLITKQVATNPANSDASYTCEPDGNVRITQTTLEMAALDGLQCYRIEGSSALISVRKFS